MKNYRQLLVLLFSIWFLSGFTLIDPPSDGNVLLKDVPQNFLHYASPKKLNEPLVSHEEQLKLYQNYLQHYFSPWNDPKLIYAKDNIAQIEKKTIHDFMADPGWGENKQRHDVKWINDIVQNMEIKNYPNTSREAITLDVTQLRAIPTHEPSFESIDTAGGGYPFDQISVSLLPANLPIKVMHLSKNRAWAFVLTPYNAYGWIPFKDFAWVDKDFMQALQNGRYVAVIKDNVACINPNGNFLFFARIGSLFTMTSREGDVYHLMGVVSDTHHQALVEEINLDKNDVTELPAPLTVKNLSVVANRILGKPYDWGGYYGYRDCSATLMDLFMPFGIWLPRNSSDQVHTGEFIALDKLDVDAKKTYIEQHAMPFLTILWAPGHVALYLDKKDSQSYIFQTVWGLHIKNWFQDDGRLLIGKTVITPLDFGEKFYYTTSFLGKIQGMGVLVPEKKKNQCLNFGRMFL